MRLLIPMVAALTALASVSGAGAQSRAPMTPTAEFDRSVVDAKAMMLVDPDLARQKAAVAERQAAAIPSARRRGVAQATAQWLQGEANLRMNAVTAADVSTKKALATVGRLSPRSQLHADILLTRGGIEGGEGRVGSALRDYQASFEIYRALGIARGQAMALIYIASLYSGALDQTTALRYYQQALDVYKSDLNLAIFIYNNRGVAFKELGRNAEAAAQFVQALSLAQRLNNRLLVPSILNNIARVDLSRNDMATANRSIVQGMALANEPGASTVRAQLLASAAQSALQSGATGKATALVEKAFATIDPATTDLSLRDSHQTAYETFMASGNAKAALVHLQAMKRLDDNATKLATSTSTALMAARFDFANQELKISQLKASDLERSIAFERASAQTQRYAFLGAAGAVAVVIGMLVFALVTSRRSRDQVRAANDDLAVTNNALGKALAAKTEFLATTSHEIRTPLNGILGMTQVMLADARLSGDLRERIGVVHGAGVTMRALVDDILDVAKMETGNLTIEHAPFDLCASVSDATRMWAEQARAKGLDFSVDLARCPAMIMGDAARVRQIVFNLLSNALKFTKAGRVSLRVCEQDAQVRVDVGDSGIGIPADKLDEIFESFRQADAGTTRQFGGTGLGLSICRNLARAMGGDVTVASQVGQGATFTLLLPLEHAAAARPATEPADTPPATLVIDRNPITRSMLKTLVAPHGGAVVFATTVEDAVARLGEGSIARVLIDDAMIRAGDDPHGALRAITGAARGAETTLLWPVTAAVERDELLATGVTRVVAKPVSGAALVEAMFGDPVAKNHAIPDLVSQAA